PELTAMRCANPTPSEPPAVMAFVNGFVPSTNSGSCGLPPVNDVAVVVSDKELTVRLMLPLLRTFSVFPVLENWSELAASALLSWATTVEDDNVPPPKFTPIVSSFGLLDVFGNGRTDGSSTRTIVTVCC